MPVDESDDEPEPYPAPEPDEHEWPTDWEPHQKDNWRDYGQPVYENLETDTGRYWYRRTWRPKKQRDGMMLRDHVELTTPEDYIDAHVKELLYPDEEVTSPVQRKVAVMDNDVDELRTAIEDIARAKIASMDADERAELATTAREIAIS